MLRSNSFCCIDPSQGKPNQVTERLPDLLPGGYERLLVIMKASWLLLLYTFGRQEFEYWQGEKAQAALGDLIEIAASISRLEKFTGRSEPTVIT
jgi:hypothetical protein